MQVGLGLASDAAQSDPLRLPVQCPQCHAPGLVRLTRLQNGMKCPHCQCQFVVGRDGQIRRIADLPHLRFACPRCHRSGQVPVALSGRAAKCPHCRLPLARGPDQKLHGVREAAELWRLSGGKSRAAAWQDRLVRFLTTGDGRLRTQSLLILALPAAATLCLTAVGLSALWDFSLETRAATFTQVCLGGDDEAMLKFIEDDAVQSVELQRWSRRFASLQDRHRPAGDRVRVEAQVIEETPAHCVLMVTMRSKFFGVRRHIQHWRQREATWLFDALATLADEAGLPADVGAAAKSPAVDRSQTSRKPAR